MNTTLREGHRVEKHSDDLVWIYGNKGYYVMRLSSINKVCHEVCYWHINDIRHAEWMHVGHYDDYQDALTAFWNAYQMGIWKDI